MMQATTLDEQIEMYRSALRISLQLRPDEVDVREQWWMNLHALLRERDAQRTPVVVIVCG